MDFIYVKAESRKQKIKRQGIIMMEIKKKKLHELCSVPNITTIVVVAFIFIFCYFNVVVFAIIMLLNRNYI